MKKETLRQLEYTVVYFVYNIRKKKSRRLRKIRANKEKKEAFKIKALSKIKFK